MRFTLQRKTELALRALRLLANRGETMQAPALADAIGTTPNFLGQVVAPLIDAGWVTSGRGPNGGYSLIQSIEQVTMLDLIQAAEGPLPTEKCVLEDGPCAASAPCALHDSWQEVQQVLLTQLRHMPVLRTGDPGEIP